MVIHKNAEQCANFGRLRTTTARWQDKRPHIARRSGGCFCKRFWRAPHIAVLVGNVRLTPNCLYQRDFSHIAASRHGR